MARKKKEKETVTLGDIPSGFQSVAAPAPLPKLEDQAELFPVEENGTPVHKIPGKLRKNS